jgi:hypothetical protein
MSRQEVVFTAMNDYFSLGWLWRLLNWCLTPEEAADEGNLVVKDFAEAEGEAGAG